MTMISQSSASIEQKSQDIDETKKRRKFGFLDRYIYAPSVYFILAVEFVERFGYYAQNAILLIFFTSQLGLSNKNAVIVYHVISMFGYFTPIFGAILSDNYIGRYRTILYFALIYFAGTTLLAVTSIPYVLEKVTMAGPLVGLFMIMLGMGGIKPCVSTFGADQFTENESDKIQSYFSIFYMSINIGSILSFIISPLLRSRVQCFGRDCYLLAFGIPAILMLIVILLFVSGSKFYVHKPTETNAVGQVAKVTYIAIRERLKNIRAKSKQPLLDWAKGYVDPVSISDTKILYKIILIFIPIPMFWALFNQQGSLWTIQAIRMSGNLGSAGYMVPDQLQVVNPVLIIFLLPLMDAIISGLKRLRVKVKPLRKIFAGMIISGFAFLISGGLEILINKEIGGSIHINDRNSGLQFYNKIYTPVKISSSFPNMLKEISLFDGEISEFIQVPALTQLNIVVEESFNQSSKLLEIPITDTDLKEKHLYSAVLYENLGVRMSSISEFEIESDSSGANIRFIFVPGIGYQGPQTFSLRLPQLFLNVSFGIPTEFASIPFGSEDAVINGRTLVPLRYTPGGVYTIIATFSNPNNIQIDTYENRSPSKYHMLLQIPQYFIITIGEILINVTGLSFAYDQAPKRIKVAITSAWLLTTAFGNLIIIIVEAIAGESTGSTIFFVFAALMFVVSFIFAIIAYYYKPTNNVVAKYEIGKSDSKDEDI